MTNNPTRGYYLNSLKSWRSDLQKQLRQLMARHAKMEGMFHPDRPDQGKLIDLTMEFIARINDEMFEVEDSARHVAHIPEPPDAN